MDTLRMSKPKARKDHVCDGCLGKISKGNEYNLFIGADNGDIITSKTCEMCAEFWAEHSSDYSYDDYRYDRGALKEALLECDCDVCGEIKAEYFPQPKEPAHE